MALRHHSHPVFVALNHLNGCVQPLIGNATHNFLNIIARATLDGEPAWAVADLNQAMVVAKANHGGHWKGQHLIGWTTPNAAHHGQEIPVLKSLAKAMLI